ncbi:MAG: AMP-binding protein [Aureliella sp.]
MRLPILDAMRKYPEQLAFDDGHNQIAYGSLAAFLTETQASVSCQSGEHVAWCPSNDLDAFLNFWAIQFQGGVACPISHRFPEPKRIEILQRLDAAWLPQARKGSTDETLDDKHSNEIKGEGSDNLDRPATIILSSGSTGQPKAVVHSMSAHIANAVGAASNMPLLPGDRWLWSLPLFHVSGLSILVRCAVNAATVVGMHAEESLDAGLLATRKVTHLSVVSIQLRRLIAEPSFPSQHLKYVLLGGSSVDPQLVAEARERGIKVLTTYGLTEMGSQVTSSTEDGNPNMSGRVLPGRELRITPSGEILVRGAPLCAGYYRDGVISPVVNNEGWFATGDLGSMNREGELSVTGRLDNMFISGGENIHPENIERVMSKAFQLNQVVVVPKPDAAFGSRPVAFVDGDLPADWPNILKGLMTAYEIPVEVRTWPAAAELSIKPDRKMLAKLAKDS